jgi:DNA polymerase I
MSNSDEEIIPIKGRLAPKNLDNCYLLSAGYDGEKQKAYLRLYEPESKEIFLWYDDTGHLPYLISKEHPEELEQNQRLVSHNGFKGLQQVVKHDALADEDILVTKVLASDPLSIGGGAGCIRSLLDESWESRIRYYACYIYDQGLVPGMPYCVIDGRLIRGNWSIPGEVREEFNEILEQTEDHLREPMKEWAALLQSPVPDIKRVAVDIEVRPSQRNRMPNADEAKEPIIAVAFVGSDGFKKILLLNDSGLEVDVPDIDGAEEVYVTINERGIIEETFRILDSYPVVLTYNGDDFDQMTRIQ